MSFQINSRDESGLTFRANNQAWVIIARFVIEKFPEIYQNTIEKHYDLKSLYDPEKTKRKPKAWESEKPWLFNDGHGLDSKNAKLLGKKILEYLEDCKEKKIRVFLEESIEMDRFLKKFAKFCLKSEGFTID